MAGRWQLAILASSVLAACGGDPVRERHRDSTGADVTPLAPATGAHHCLIFVTVDCPLANNYAPEIGRIAAEYGGRGVAFWLVHVDPDVDFVRARQHAEEFGHRTPILLDPEHALVAAVGARCTPEAAVIDDRGAVVYRGRIDDWFTDYGRKRPAPTTRELRDALDAVLAGRAPDPARTESLGCLIDDFR